MNTLLLAVDDGLTNANFNAADIFFLIAAALGVLAGLAYIAGFPVAEGTPNRWGQYVRWSSALVALAVASVAFGLFLL